MTTITRRLQRLEQRIPRSAPRYTLSAVAHIEAWLVRAQVVRLETESLADAFARSLGITSIELRTRFQQRAAGLRVDSYLYLVITREHRSEPRLLLPAQQMERCAVIT
jgi:hypothetical protein